MTIERAAMSFFAVVLAFAIGFTVWMFGFDNGGCPQGQHPVITGYTTVLITGKYGVTVDQVPDFACAAGQS